MTEQEFDDNIDGRVVFIRKVEPSYGWGSMKVEVCVDGKQFTLDVNVDKTN